MAHAISLTDGATTINLNLASGNMTRDYAMAGKADNGSDPNNPEFTETIDIMVVASSKPNLQIAINAIELMLQAAKRRLTDKNLPRVYLQFQADGESDTYRAELKDADLIPDKDALRQWPNAKADHSIALTRYTWEGPRAELAISSATSTSPATGGKPITNGANNWVQILGSQVGGVLPTPLELQLTNTSGGSVGYRNFYLAVNAFSDPTNFAHILEAEARQSGYGTITANAGCSGGNYNNYTFTTNGEIRYDLSAALMQDTQGRKFQILLRPFAWSGTDIYIQPVLKDASASLTLATGDEYKLPAISGSPIISLGSIPLPAGGYYTNYAATVLAFVMRSTGAAIFNTDFYQLTPLDAYQYIVQLGKFIPNGATVTFDNIEGVYHVGGDTIFSPRAGMLRLWPGLTQRILILQDEGTSSTVARSFSVRAFIRARRLTV